MQNVTNELIRMMAAADGITIPDERLELVRRQYEAFLQDMAEINTLPLAREAQPAVPVVVPADLPDPGKR